MPITQLTLPLERVRVAGPARGGYHELLLQADHFIAYLAEIYGEHLVYQVLQEALDARGRITGVSSDSPKP